MGTNEMTPIESTLERFNREMERIDRMKDNAIAQYDMECAALRRSCTHRNVDGSSAVVPGMFCGRCRLCGEVDA